MASLYFVLNSMFHLLHGTSYSGTYAAPSTAQLKEAAKIAYFGWYKDLGRYGSDGVLENEKLKQYALTQQYIWEYLGQSNATFVDPNVQAEYVNFKNEINEKMNTMSKRVSFDATTISLDIGETKTLTDSNGVLKDYKTVDFTRNGIRFTHNKGENTLTINVSDDCSLESFKFTDALAKEVGLIKEESENSATTVYIRFC